MNNPYPQVKISDEEWEKCLVYQELKMNTPGHYGDRKDNWGRGLRADACAIGKGGEYAVRRWLTSTYPSLEVSEVGEFVDIRGYGDGGIDLIAGGIKMDIKSTSKGLYIPSTGAGSYKKNCDVFVWVQPRLQNYYWIRGYILREDLSGFSTIDSYIGDHKIYDIPNDKLGNLKDLIDRKLKD